MFRRLKKLAEAGLDSATIQADIEFLKGVQSEGEELKNLLLKGQQIYFDHFHNSGSDLQVDPFHRALQALDGGFYTSDESWKQQKLTHLRLPQAISCLEEKVSENSQDEEVGSGNVVKESAMMKKLKRVILADGEGQSDNYVEELKSVFSQAKEKAEQLYNKLSTARNDFSNKYNQDILLYISATPVHVMQSLREHEGKINRL